MNEILSNKHSVTTPVIIDTSAMELNDDYVEVVPDTNQEEKIAEESFNENKPSKDEEDTTTMGKEKELKDQMKMSATGCWCEMKETCKD